MSDAALRSAERAHADDVMAWRPLLALLLRAGRDMDAVAMLNDTGQRLFEAGKGLLTAARNEHLCGVEGGPALVSMKRNGLEILRAEEERRTIEERLREGQAVRA